MPGASVEVDGQRIEELRKAKFWQRKDLAALVGITAHRLYIIERKQPSTSPQTVRRLQLALNVSAQEITAQTHTTDAMQDDSRAQKISA